MQYSKHFTTTTLALLAALVGLPLVAQSQPSDPGPDALEPQPQTASSQSATPATWEELTAAVVQAIRSDALDKAYEFQARAMQLVTPAHPGDVRPAQTLALLGEIHRAADKPELAEQAYLAAVASAEQAVVPNDPAMTSTLESLANFYYYRDEFDKVAPIYERILKISQFALAQAERQVAVRCRNLADVDDKLKNYAAAEPLYQEALAAGDRSGRTFRPELIQDTLEVAAFYRSRGKYDQATALAERANHMAEHTIGPSSMDVALALDSLAETHLAAGKPAEAEQLAERALAISEKLTGSDSSDLAPRLVTLAKIEAALQKRADAQAKFDRALALTEKNLGADSPEMVSLLGQYADLLDALGKTNEAKARRKQADLILHPEVHEPTPAE